MGNVDPSLRWPVTTRPTTDDMPLAGSPVALDVAVMPATIGFRHQNTDVLPDRFIGAIAKKTFRGDTKGSDNSVLADDDHRIGYRVEDRLEMLLVQTQFMFRALPLVDVEENAGHCFMRRFSGQRRTRTFGMQPLFLATGANNANLDIESACCLSGGECRANTFAIIGMKEG